MANIFIMDHPLIQHKIGLIRRKETGTKDFRQTIGEIAMLICYEATRELKLTDVEIETPICRTTAKELSGKKMAIVPILRAGLGMVDGMLTLIPAAKVGHIGICRDEDGSGNVHVYYCKLPFDIKEREVIIMDLMLGTGKTAVKAIERVKESGAENVKFMAVVACPEGVGAIRQAHPDVEIYCGALDEGINEDLYIVPGIGDGGDRIFGTK